MENEEIRGLIHRKASKDQFVTFFQFSVGSLSHYSLSHTLGYLEFYWSIVGGCGILGFLEKEGKGRVGKHRKALRSAVTSDLLACTHLHVCFLH